MATTKPTGKKAPAKKTTAKKPATKKPAAKKTTAKKVEKQPEIKSFRLTKEDKFFTTRVTLQTVYWSILSIVILVLVLWILNVQLETIELLDSINASL